MRDYRPLLSNVAILVEDVEDYLLNPLQDDQLDTDFSLEDVKRMLEGITDMFNDFEEEYDT